MSEVRIAIVGLGNCASSLVQGLEYYKDADPNESVPGLMHVELGGYHIHDVRSSAAFDVDANKVGKDVADAIFTEPNNTIRFSDVPPTGITVQRGHTLDGLGTYYREMITESDAPEADVVAGVARHAGRRADLLPAGGLGAGRQVLRPVRDRRGRGVRERAAGLHRERPGVGQEVRRCRRADRGRRHQVAGRRHDHAPRPREALRGSRRGTRPYLPAELRRQHGLHEHAGARAPDVEEDLQDAIGAVPARPAARQGEHPHRPERPRAVARGSQVGDDPARGSQLRRCTAHDRDETRGVGLAELRRRDHRRAALRQAREGPRHRRPDHRPVRLLHEVARRCSSATRKRGRWSRSSPTGRPRSRWSTDRRTPTSRSDQPTRTASAGDQPA